MQLEGLLTRLEGYDAATALVIGGQPYTYRELDSRRLEWLHTLRKYGVQSGSVIGLKADYSVDSIALVLALVIHQCVVGFIPLSASRDDGYLKDSQMQGVFRFSNADSWAWQDLQTSPDHPLLMKLKSEGTPGFVVFSSGSSGRPKAVLHSVERFLRKFQAPGKSFRTLAFLVFDHIAGIDTLLYTLSNGGTLIVPDLRDPFSVCRLIQEERVEVLPTSPTFLNMLCLSQAYKEFDLSSLKIITYGSEPMSQSGLDRLNKVFTNKKIIQKYGTSEFGAPRARSRSNDSLWLELKTDEVEAKVEGDRLWVKADTAMLGYLNAPSPFDDEGWYCTGDVVERDGDWIRILGRESDIINVGGEKVHPSEVEAVILELPFVVDVLVRGEANPLTGQIVAATVMVDTKIDERKLRREIRRHCRGKLAPHKIPIRVEVGQTEVTTERQKKFRR